jgi:FkbM family methyltransferase
MDIVFDVGMYDGSDTAYYLETGHGVVAVEANPMLCQAATRKFQRYIGSGQLIIENVAVSSQPGEIELHICGQDLGSSSIVAAHLIDRQPLASFTVGTVTVRELIRRHGKPKYLKVDIEGADKECVMSLTTETAPKYLSFEAHHEIEEMIEYAASIGYSGFKIINQNTFRAVQNQECLTDRVRRKVVRLAGYEQPSAVRRKGRVFTLDHSAGPAPWESDGKFYSKDDILVAWRRAKDAGRIGGWYDVHAEIA